MMFDKNSQGNKVSLENFIEHKNKTDPFPVP